MAAAIAGKYEHVKNENLEAYFKAIGISDTLLEKLNKLASVLEIVVDGDKITTKGRNELHFVLGKEFDDPMPTGEVLKSVASMDGKKMVIKSTTPDGRKGSRTYEPTAEGLTIVLASEVSSVVAKRIYKKL